MVLLVATDFIRNMFPDLKWNSKTWTTRTPGPFKKATVFWALADSVPFEFEPDVKYNWLVDGQETEAYFTPDILNAWHSESHGTGQISRNPHIIYGERRELTVHEKLAALAPPPDIIPPPVSRRPGSLNTKRETLPQLCRQEIAGVMREFGEQELKVKAEQARARGAREAEARKKIAHICAMYGQPVVPVVFPQ